MRGRPTTRVQVPVDDGALDVRVLGHGPLVVMIPSLGRGADDFEDLAAHVVASGYRVACPEPRGIGPTTAPLAGITMVRLADDVAAVIETCGDGPAVTVGHAFGNRVARMTATDHPDLVRGVALLACGGAVPPSDEAATALRLVFDPTLPTDEHLAHVRAAFFAPGNDPAVWADGWHPRVAAEQAAANRVQSVAHWWEAGRAPVLVVQPEQDVIAVVANAIDLVERLGDRAELVLVADAGHALLPEQPDAVAAVLIDWLDRLPA